MVGCVCVELFRNGRVCARVVPIAELTSLCFMLVRTDFTNLSSRQISSLISKEM